MKSVFNKIQINKKQKKIFLFEKKSLSRELMR